MSVYLSEVVSGSAVGIGGFN
ncbi:MAG: hypothetical protein K0Q46_3159, partial [Rhodococcus erythropolis]|nr:hypothetical protein [Rhodococcus erythropolis]